MRDRGYLGFTFAFIFSFSTVFAYVAASPFILQETYGFTPVQYAIIFAFNTGGMVLVALANAKLVRRLGPLFLAKVGNAILVTATIGLAMATLVDANRWAILAGFFLVVASNGINFANYSALAISRAGELTGSASAFMGSGQFLMAGVLSPLVGLAAAAGMSQSMAMTGLYMGAGVLRSEGRQGRRKSSTDSDNASIGA